MEKLLHIEQEKFKAIFQNASLGILVINKSGIIMLVNDFLLEQFGYSDVDELTGKKWKCSFPIDIIISMLLNGAITWNTQ